MRCIQNPKRFLFWKWNGDHEDKIIRFGRFMSCSNNYIVLYECKHCGRQYKKSFVSEATLLEQGVDIETIKQHRSIIF